MRTFKSTNRKERYKGKQIQNMKRNHEKNGWIFNGW